MIARLHRFHGYGSLRGVYNRGQTIRSPLVSLKFLARANAQPYRLAVVVSKKVSKSAVVRNRIRRRIYELMRRREQMFPPGLDMVFTVFSDELATMGTAKLETIVGDLADRAISRPREQSVRYQASPHGIVKSKRE